MINLKTRSLKEMENIKEEDVSDVTTKISENLKTYTTDILFNEELMVDIVSKDDKNELDRISLILNSEKFTEFDVILLAKYLKIIEFFVNKTISENNFVYLFPVAVIFYVLRLDITFLNQIVESEIFSKIIEVVHNYLLKIENTWNVPDDAPYYEKETFKRYLSAIGGSNLIDVYIFIESVERGRGIYASYFVSFLARIVLLKPKKYFLFLELLTDPFTLEKFLLLINNKLEDTFLEICLNSNNKWLIFGYLRQIFKELNSSRVLTKEEIRDISKLFEKLYIIDKDFFITGIFFLAKYSNKKCLGYCVGIAFSNINEKNLVKTLIDKFGIKQNSTNLDLWTFIASALKKDKNEELLGFLAQTTFKKWNIFLKERFNSNEYESRLVLTDYLNIIIYFMAECLEKDKSKFLEILNKKLDFVINYKSFWVSNASSKRFIYLSYVYCMSEAWKHIGEPPIDVITIKNKIIFIIDDERLYLSLYDDGISHKKILKIKENFGII